MCASRFKMALRFEFAEKKFIVTIATLSHFSAWRRYRTDLMTSYFLEIALLVCRQICGCMAARRHELEISSMIASTHHDLELAAKEMKGGH